MIQIKVILSRAWFWKWERNDDVQRSNITRLPCVAYLPCCRPLPLRAGESVPHTAPWEVGYVADAAQESRVEGAAGHPY